MTIDGVLFDVDDTLVDTRGAFGDALVAVGRHYLPPGLADARADELLTVWRADRGDHYRAYTRGELSFTEQRRLRANDLHRIFGGPPLDGAAFAVWDEAFERAFADGWRAHPDAPPVVDRLLAAGLRVGALSNAGVAYQVDKLARVGLGDRVPMLVGIDTLDLGKPHPEVFVAAAGRLGTEPARTVYVGDELDIDAAAARAAGLVGIWLDRPGVRRVTVTDEEIAAAGVPVITTLAELPGLLGLA